VEAKQLVKKTRLSIAVLTTCQKDDKTMSLGNNFNVMAYDSLLAC